MQLYWLASAHFFFILFPSCVHFNYYISSNCCIATGIAQFNAVWFYISWISWKILEKVPINPELPFVVWLGINPNKMAGDSLVHNQLHYIFWPQIVRLKSAETQFIQLHWPSYILTTSNVFLDQIKKTRPLSVMKTTDREIFIQLTRSELSVSLKLLAGCFLNSLWCFPVSWWLYITLNTFIRFL